MFRHIRGYDLYTLRFPSARLHCSRAIYLYIGYAQTKLFVARRLNRLFNIVNTLLERWRGEHDRLRIFYSPTATPAGSQTYEVSEFRMQIKLKYSV